MHFPNNFRPRRPQPGHLHTSDNGRKWVYKLMQPTVLVICFRNINIAPRQQIIKRARSILSPGEVCIFHAAFIRTQWRAFSLRSGFNRDCCTWKMVISFVMLNARRDGMENIRVSTKKNKNLCGIINVFNASEMNNLWSRFYFLCD